jgi:hypothetical protein
VDIGLLDYGGQGLLNRAPRLEERGKIGAGAQAPDAQLDAAGPGLPVPIAIPVALRQALAALLAIVSTGLGADLILAAIDPPDRLTGARIPSAARQQSRSTREEGRHRRSGRWRACPSLSTSARRSIMGLVIGGIPRFRLAQQPDPSEKPDGHRKLNHALRRHHRICTSFVNPPFASFSTCVAKMRKRRPCEKRQALELPHPEPVWGT